MKNLLYIPNYFSVPDQEEYLNVIDCLGKWSNVLKRRTQHYGYRYDYTKKKIDSSMFLGDPPQWIRTISQRLSYDNFFEKEPDQIIINEYLPGQGISRHVDCVSCFGETIASLSLGSACVMQFEHIRSHEIRHLLLEPGSLLVLKNSARYDWMHSIPAQKTDVIDNRTIIRSRRVSLTFRTVKL